MKIRFNSPEKKMPNDDRGVRIQYGEAKRAHKPWRWYLILFVASLPLLYLIGLALREIVIIKADGRISVPQITVRSAGDGYVSRILAEPLQTVSKGAALALLTDSVLDNNYQRLKKEIDFLCGEKDKLLLHANDLTPSSMQLIAFAREQKKFYYNRLRQFESLFQQGAATQAELATARSQYNSALENLTVQENAQRRNRGAQSEVRQIVTRINQLSSELERIENQKQQLHVLSPERGLITEIFAQPGEFLGKGQPLLGYHHAGKSLHQCFHSTKIPGLCQC